MLVLTRKIGECIHIGDGVVVTVQDARGGRIRLSVLAPSNVLVLRGELIGRRPGPQEWSASQPPTTFTEEPMQRPCACRRNAPGNLESSPEVPE